MIEVTFALIISAVAGVFAVKAAADANRLQFGVIQGDSLAAAAAGGAKYQSEHFSELQSGAGVTYRGVTLAAGTEAGQTYSPTIQQLVSMGYLDPAFSPQATFTNIGTPGNYQMRLSRAPAGCELVAVTSCDIEGRVYIDQPIRAAGSTTEPDTLAVNAIVSRLGGNGGFSLLVNSGTIYGGNWTTPNPVSGTPAGVVMARFGYGASGLSQFVRLNDSRDPNLQGGLTVAKQSKADSFVTPEKVIGSACATPNAIASGNASGLICTDGAWQSLGDRASLGDACGVAGRVATAKDTGEQLFCKNGVYIRSASLVASRVLVGRATVHDLDTVTKPTCEAGGVADRSFSLTQVSTNMTVTPPKQSMYTTTIDNGATWQVVIRLRADTGEEESGNAHNVTAILNVECKY